MTECLASQWNRIEMYISSGAQVGHMTILECLLKQMNTKILRQKWMRMMMRMMTIDQKPSTITEQLRKVHLLQVEEEKEEEEEVRLNL